MFDGETTSFLFLYGDQYSKFNEKINIYASITLYIRLECLPFLCVS